MHNQVNTMEITKLNKQSSFIKTIPIILFQKEDHGTSHVSVLDTGGNGVSATSTVNRWFGAVVQSPALGIVWNDEMDDFSTPGKHVNCYV